MKLLLLLSMLFYSVNSIAGATQWIDFTLESGHVKIPVIVAGIDGYALLDTGAQLNAINPRFINKHQLSFDKGKKVRVKGIYGIEDKKSYNNVPTSFFGINTELDNLTEVNLGFHTTSLLFGAGFFNQFVMQLDYPNQKMRLITHDSIKLRDLENIKMQTQKGSGMPIVEVGLQDGQSVWLLLDTGNNGGLVIERKVARQMGWLDNLDITSGISMGANSIATTESFRIPTLKFGPFELENVLVSIPAEGQKAYLESQYEATGSRIKGRKVQGLIGYDVLKHFLITIDYKNGHAHIGLPDEK
ncbi:signal protein PDZ [Pseudoalteromonas sp. S1727]|uniref:pepsin/retropepsin-like aspartic protease family protein n=1 Tax=Pseudoalteromonas sp. S1727 TaxID=2066514 RepID=UPI0011082BE9|nr:pepsin/retropepsin-like aspartic protease family protein [Pseudoalteromonas sp. S1727]TMN71175.1 signal protein PDZ [Pseudoalteromonas sp. S1727]